jgi:FtsZ-interacting cell division protein ZipA
MNEPSSTTFSFLNGLTWSDFFQTYKSYIIGSIIILSLLVFGIWWWNNKKVSTNESEEAKVNQTNKTFKHKHNNNNKNNDNNKDNEKTHKPHISEKDFDIGKEKMKDTLHHMDKATEDLKKVIESIRQTNVHEISSEDISKKQEELTNRIDYILNFIKKMNEQAKKFGGFLLEDSRKLKKYTSDFQAIVDKDVKSAQEKFENAVLLVQDLTKEISSNQTETEPDPEIVVEEKAEPILENTEQGL